MVETATATILERALNCASTWSAQEYEISKNRYPVAQSKFSNRDEASDNTVDKNLQLGSGSHYT